MREKIRKIIKGVAVKNCGTQEDLEIDNLSLDDLGFDSLDKLEVSDEIEEELPIKISNKDFDRIFTSDRKIKDIVSLLVECI